MVLRRDVCVKSGEGARKSAVWNAILDRLSRNSPASKSQTGSFKVLADLTNSI
jgi:hypothetical protein